MSIFSIYQINNKPNNKNINYEIVIHITFEKYPNSTNPREEKSLICVTTIFVNVIIMIETINPLIISIIIIIVK
ncbi:putative ORFan [Cotonvirus japonicus]|uniref:ORFan n=1 Tax=Cotonvirus japonicus TaxID=2811091 RepID=A0ABM7NT38_9VIRU|nr:putative ORFan [Cotonvirus japonicus]BCS83338.1 putative ORFan [Cotonvirus japonicus]